jgi:hypothetical protein
MCASSPVLASAPAQQRRIARRTPRFKPKKAINPRTQRARIKAESRDTKRDRFVPHTFHTANPQTFPAGAAVFAGQFLPTANLSQTMVKQALTGVASIGLVRGPEIRRCRCFILSCSQPVRGRTITAWRLMP